jgi:TatD DNase family protein
MIDTHCHLTHPRLSNEADAVVARAREAGLRACITIGTGIEDARQGAALALRHPDFVFRAAGIDPFTAHAIGGRFAEELEAIRVECQGPNCVALGEVGLDYHYDLDPPALQASKLERQLDLALDLDLPVVIHVREAHDDMASLLAAHPDNRGVIHSFTAGPREAEAYLELGWYLAFNGVLTFKNANEVREAARLAPEDRLLIETDSPYLAPVPLRGKRCEPAHVVHTLAKLAELRAVEPERMAQVTSRNATRLFGFEMSCSTGETG